MPGKVELVATMHVLSFPVLRRHPTFLNERLVYVCSMTPKVKPMDVEVTGSPHPLLGGSMAKGVRSSISSSSYIRVMAKLEEVYADFDAGFALIFPHKIKFEAKSLRRLV